MPQFTVSHLDLPLIEKAFPLIWIAAPDMDRQRWIEHCDHVVSIGGGVLGVTASDGAILGVAVYRPDRELRRGRILRIDTLVAFELGSADSVCKSLCDAVELLCHDLGASGMTLNVPDRGHGDDGSSKAQRLKRLGLRLESVSFASELAADKAAAPSRRPELVGGNPV